MTDDRPVCAKCAGCSEPCRQLGEHTVVVCKFYNPINGGKVQTEKNAHVPQDAQIGTKAATHALRREKLRLSLF